MNIKYLLKGQRVIAVLLFLLIAVLLSACTNSDKVNSTNNNIELVSPTTEVEETDEANPLVTSYEVDEQDGTVFYEIFVRAFYDSNGDGIGDLNGVTAKLDYLQDLGIGGIWLMPILQNNTYHGYDTTDYYHILPEYGTEEDLKNLIKEAHARNIKVVMDLVVNHSSSDNPWFQEALHNKDSKYRNWYQFAKVDEKVRSDSAAGSVAWHTTPDGTEKYLGIFVDNMPDLNFDEPEVREEFIKIGQYWLEVGLDGYRLDAAKHIFGDYKSTLYEQETIDKNVKWWQEFRAGMVAVNPNVYLIGEVWDSSTLVAPFFNNALDSAFNFDIAERIVGAAKDERDSDLAYSLVKAYKLFNKSSNGQFLDAPFLTNHDQTRVMSAVHGKVERAKVAASILLTLPGTPYLYYGEEIGMQGIKPDEDIREPMIWYKDKAGGVGQSTWKVAKYNTGDAHVSVEQQLADKTSILNHYKQLISWRKELPALQNGDIFEFTLTTRNFSLTQYVRATADERVLVIHNLSDAVQLAELDQSTQFGEFTEIMKTTNNEALLQGATLTIPPYSTVIMK